MYCSNCGVRLADTEAQCPLCSTRPGKQPVERGRAMPLYPQNRYPETTVKPGAINGVLLILFLIPLFITFFVDLQTDGRLTWFAYVAGGLLVGYVTLALPVWFKNPNPVIFVPCDFAAAALYLLLIEGLSGGSWFLSFALPVVGCLGSIVSAVVTLLRYVRGGRLYIFGGALMALGASVLLVEFLLMVTFDIPFWGWSVYPLVALFLLGGMLIDLAINATAREKMERRFFV